MYLSQTWWSLCSLLHLSSWFSLHCWNLADFQLYLLDCDHCDGVLLVYTTSSLLVSPIFISSDIEFFLFVNKGHNTFSAGTFYCPPSSPHDLDILYDTLTALNPSYLLNLILVGDFNVDLSNHFSPLLHKLSVISDSFSLHSKSYTLFLLRFPFHNWSCLYSYFISTMILLYPFSSEHNAILFSLPFSSSVSPNPSASPRQVCVYDQANYQLANDLLSSVPWDSTLTLSDPESAWLIFNDVFLSIMHTTLPSKLVYPSPRFSAPWINGSLLSCIKFRNVIYCSANCTGSPSLWSFYRYFRNQTLQVT